MRVDKEWAKVQAEERKVKLCAARTLQYYRSSRVKEFHVSLSTPSPPHFTWYLSVCHNGITFEMNPRVLSQSVTCRKSVTSS